MKLFIMQSCPVSHNFLPNPTLTNLAGRVEEAGSVVLNNNKYVYRV